MPRRYAILDVFTDQLLEGNPLAVVLDAEGLNDEQMQSIAREFNLSETTFVLPPNNPAHSASVRFFTPAHELPFAGHPTVGTAVLLARERWGESAQDLTAMVLLEEKVGSIRVGVNLSKTDGYAEFNLPVLPSEVGQPGERDTIAAALGLARREVGFENHVPSVFDAGNSFTFVPVADLTSLRKASPQRAHWSNAFAASRGHAYVYTREAVGHDADFQARMFAPTMGIEEDPATGSAVAGFAGVIHKFDAPLAGKHDFLIEQGFEMQRPSYLYLQVEVGGKSLTDASIGGRAVIVARGELYID